MLVIKNCRLWLVVLLAGFLASCSFTPPGPRALLKGEQLIQQGKYDQAIESLQTAVRLLPKNAQAWNYLGLAYHGARQPAQALKAYSQALALDHKLAAARFNLGCLYLDQNDLAQAIEQLTSYTLIEPRSVSGWLKLGTAQLRARRLDLAEKFFKTVLELQPRHPEALNGLGVVQFQRRRIAEAQNYFSQALAQASNYPPALLNSALLAQQGYNNRPLALQKYRQYLLLQPRPENWAAVLALASQLELELKPPPETLAQKPVMVPTIRTNLPHPRTDMVARAVSTNPPPLLAAARTNVSLAKTTPPKPALPLPANTMASAPPGPKTSSAPNLVHATVPARSGDSLPPKPDLEVTQVAEDLVIKPPQEISNTAPPAISMSDSRETPAANPSSPSFKSPNPKPEKRGIFSRLNPFSSRPKTQPAPIVIASGSNVVKEINPPATNAPVTSVPLPPPPPLPRYTFLSPPRPAAGKHADAEPYFTQGVKSQQAGQYARAFTEYQKAVQLDPAYFEAYYNQGLAAYELGIGKTALGAFEYALAIKPDSIEARYNFALALRQANYLLDSAAQLQQILKDHPGEVRANLSLGNLYAQKFNQPDLAREHYLKVLQADPQHPKAAEIRYWLGAHP